jgi:hypothetical protein
MKKKSKVMLKLSELVVGEWYGCSSWESNIKAKYSIHSLFDADKLTIRREQIKTAVLILDLINIYKVF